MSEGTLRTVDQPISNDAVKAMTLVSGPVTWMERLTDRLNPIFVKEGRQSLRSKTFIVAFLLMVFTGWFISVFGVMASSQDIEYGTAGMLLFQWYFGILAVAITLIVPFGAFRSLITERDEYTFEPLIITSLSPRQIVNGKLLTAMLQAFLFYSAIAPFMAFTSLLNGFDMAYAAFLLIFGLLYSLLVASAALAIGSLVRGRVWQTIVSIGILGGLLFALGTEFTFAFGSGFERELDESGFWVGFGFVVLGAVSYILLLQQVAVINLTFETDNRSTGLRVIAFGQWVILWVSLIVVYQYYSTGAGSWSSHAAKELAIMGLVLSVIHWSAVGIAVVTERDELTLRVRYSLPNRTAYRVLLSPYMPGGSRGLVLIVGCIGVTWMLVYTAFQMSSSSGRDDFEMAGIICLYVVIHACIGSLMSQMIYRLWPNLKPSHVRVSVIIGYALMWMLPLFAMAYFSSQRMYNHFSLFYLPSPFLTCDSVWGRAGERSLVMLVLGGWAAILLALCAVPMLRGLAQIVKSPPMTVPDDAESDAV